MIDLVQLNYKELISGSKEQKLTGKNSQLLSDVKIGDVLKGTLTKLDSGQIAFLSQNGEQVPVKLQGTVLFNEMVALEVLEKDDGQVLLKLLQSPGNEPLQNKIIRELGLPETNPMRQLIESFLAKQIPLQREGLLKNYHMHQQFQIPAEVLTNINEQAKPISLQEAEMLNKTKDTMLENMLGIIEDLVSDVKDEELAKSIYGVLEKSIDAKTLQEALESFEKTVLKNMMSTEESQVGEGKLENQTLPVGENNERILEGTDSKNTNKLVDWNDEQIVEKSEMINAKDVQFNKNQGVQEYLEMVLEEMKPEMWEKFGRLTKDLLLKCVTVDIKKLEQNLEEGKHIEDGTKVLKEILKTLEEAKLPEKHLTSLKQLEEVTQVIQKFNVQGEYYFFPLNLPKGEGKGELYFFKPKKKVNEEKDHLYIVLALDLPTLNKIEVHMRQEKEKLLIHFKVKEQGIVQFLENHLKSLKQVMSQTKFNIEEVDFSLLAEKSEENNTENLEASLSHMDFKI